MRARVTVCLAVMAALVVAAAAEGRGSMKGELRGIERELGTLVRAMKKEQAPASSDDVSLPEGPPEKAGSGSSKKAEFVACVEDEEGKAGTEDGKVKKAQCTAPQATPKDAQKALEQQRTSGTEEVTTAPPRTVGLDEKEKGDGAGQQAKTEPVKTKVTEKLLAVSPQDLASDPEALVSAVGIASGSIKSVGQVTKQLTKGTGGGRNTHLAEVVRTGEELSKAYGLGDIRLEELAEHTLALEQDLDPAESTLIADMDEEAKKGGSEQLTVLKGSAKQGMASARSSMGAGLASLRQKTSEGMASAQARVDAEKTKLKSQAEAAQKSATEAVDGARKSATEAVDGAKKSASEAADGARKSASDAAQSARDTAANVRQEVQDTSAKIEKRAKDLSTSGGSDAAAGSSSE